MVVGALRTRDMTVQKLYVKYVKCLRLIIYINYVVLLYLCAICEHGEVESI